MEPGGVLRINGVNFSKEKDEEINIWYTTHHVPLILTGQCVAGERFERIGPDKDKIHPKYLANYEFNSEDDVNDYMKGPLLNFAHIDRRQSFPDPKDFSVVWSVNYKMIAKRGSDERSLAFGTVATNLPKGTTEAEYTEWYNNNHMLFVMRSPEIIRAERYERMGNDEKYPRYLAIYRYADAEAIEERRKTWLGQNGVADRQKTYPDDKWQGVWKANYRMLSKERKDLVE